MGFSAPFMSVVPQAARSLAGIRNKEIEMTNATVRVQLPTISRWVSPRSPVVFFTRRSGRRRVAVIGCDVANVLFPTSVAARNGVRSKGQSTASSGLKEREIFLVGAEDPNNENKAVYLGPRPSSGFTR